MVKRLIIAEKREQAEKYAQALGRSKRVDYSYHVKPDLHIAFCRGHLLNIINNAKEAYQSRENLPFFPETIEYGFKPNGKTKSEKAADLKSLKAYFKNIQKEIEWADEIIVGTDSDREGESIFYTLLNQFPKAKAKIKWRLWANSLTKDGVRKAYDHLKPAEDTYSLYIAADARRIADWLFGVANGSPLVLMDLKDKGVILDKKEKLTVGRIKCPMMKLVIDNNEAIKNHVSKPFWKLEAKDQHEVIFRQKVIYGGEDNNLTQADAQKAFEKTQSFARVVKVEHDEVIQTAPKLFNLNGLQDYCSKKHHLSANQTLEIVKELRSDGYLSYPRTDCTFITEYEFAYLKNNVKAYQKLLETPFELVNMEPRKKYVNSKKVKEHYALIPTEELPDLEKLSSHHRLIYEIVTKRTLMMFAQDKKIAKTNVVINNGEEFSTTGNVVIDQGWGELVTRSSKDKVLPNYQEGEQIQVTTTLKEGLTQPPERLTESAMLKLLKKYLIGTPATRAEALANLVKDKFITYEKSTGKYTPTNKAYLTIRMLENRHSKFIDPETSGKWEVQLQLIEEGKSSASEFLESVKDEIIQTVKG